MTTRHARSADRPGAAIRLDSQLCFALYSASLAMTRRYRGLLGELELTYPQYLVMLVLWEEDGMRVGDIGERLFLDSATLTPLLKRLESAGLVTRTRAPDDERSVIVALTAQGRALRERARGVPGQVGRAACLSGRERDELRVSLQTLRRHLVNA